MAFYFDDKLGQETPGLAAWSVNLAAGPQQKDLSSFGPVVKPLAPAGVLLNHVVYWADKLIPGASQ